jgi:hypothetical protein
MRNLAGVVLAALAAAVVWLLLRAVLIADAGLVTWIALFVVAGLAAFAARFVRPRSMAAASIVVAVLAPVAGVVLDLRVFTPLLVGSVAVLGFLAAITGLIGLARSADTRADRLGWGLALVGLASNIAVVILAWNAVVQNNRALAFREATRSVVNDMRNLYGAQEAYRSLNGGFYDRLGCLTTERPCIPDYPETAPTFLDAAFAEPLKHGYRFTFHPGPSAESADPDEAKISPTSLQAYAYVAIPADPELQGAPTFCLDSTGRICRKLDSSEPIVTKARCEPSPECEDLP